MVSLRSLIMLVFVLLMVGVLALVLFRVYPYYGVTGCGE